MARYCPLLHKSHPLLNPPSHYSWPHPAGSSRGGKQGAEGVGQRGELSCAALPPAPQKDVKELEAAARQDVRAVEATCGKVHQGQEGSVSLWGDGGGRETLWVPFLRPHVPSFLPPTLDLTFASGTSRSLVPLSAPTRSHTWCWRWNTPASGRQHCPCGPGCPFRTLPYATATSPCASTQSGARTPGCMRRRWHTTRGSTAARWSWG